MPIAIDIGFEVLELATQIRQSQYHAAVLWLSHGHV